LWLKEQRIEVNISTISRWLKKHGQVQQLWKAGRKASR
jgi:arginine repressor